MSNLIEKVVVSIMSPDFSGSKDFDLWLDENGAIEEECWSELDQYLDDFDDEKSPGGPFIEQIKADAKAHLQHHALPNTSEAHRTNLVLPYGEHKDLDIWVSSERV